MKKEEIITLIKPIHKNFTDKVYKKIRKKISSLKYSLIKRSGDYEVKCDITTKELEVLLLKDYGKPCQYCKDTLTVYNMVCDHIIPISIGGPSTVDNLEFICKRCNIRKGYLPKEDYKNLLKWLHKRPETLRSYVLRRLSKGGRY